MKRCFTLLELMIGISLLVISASAVGWRVHKAVESYRFSADVDRFKLVLVGCRVLALNMQSDWEGVLYQEKGEWVFKAECSGDVKLSKVGPFELRWEGEKKETISFLFSSTGETLVGKEDEGTLVLLRKKLQSEIRFPQVFQIEQKHEKSPR